MTLLLIELEPRSTATKKKHALSIPKKRVENAEENRLYFAKLKQIYVDIIHKNIDNVFMEELSMGMTGDYEIAILEGATYVRVGTGIFGERQYNTV